MPRGIFAAVLSRTVALHGEGDVVIVLSGHNADEPAFRDWIAAVRSRRTAPITNPQFQSARLPLDVLGALSLSKRQAARRVAVTTASNLSFVVRGGRGT